jgi:hypothetical protein
MPLRRDKRVGSYGSHLVQLIDMRRSLWRGLSERHNIHVSTEFWLY